MPPWLTVAGLPMNRIENFICMLLLALCCAQAWCAPSLQAWIDATPAGATLSPPPGTYGGPVVITKPIVLDGEAKVTLDGGGSGTVLTIRGGGTTVRRLHITHSGDSHDGLDAAMLVEGNSNVIEENVVDDVLFGIFLKQSNGNRVRANRIRSRHEDPAERGDAVRLWYSFGNRIEDNDIAGARDVSLANSQRNRIVGNRVTGGRTALHMVFAGRTLVEGNTFSHNTGGIFALNSDGLIIRNNRILHTVSASGVGVALKETSSALIEGNEIVRCSVGILADSPMHPINRISIIGNRIAHCITGIAFYGERGGHLVHRNHLEHNLSQVTTGGFGDALGNDWRGNYWDDYQGFDRNHDGVGDTPYELYAYADRIWIGEPKAQFFRGSPLLELIDFLERLAPFALPDLVLRDPEPQAHERVGSPSR